MKIGVTGATGQFGNIVVEQLKKKVAADSIVALVRNPQKANGLGVETRLFDYDKPEILPDALKGVDSLLLISGSEIGQRIRQHANVIGAAKKAGVKWIVYTSLLHANTSTMSLAGEHSATEAALKESGIAYTLLRNGWYTENYNGSIQKSLATGVFIGCAGDGKISSSARADYAEAAAIVIADESHKGKVYELAADQAYTFADMAAEISRQTGKDIPYKNLPEAEYAAILKNAGLPEAIAMALAGWDISTSKGDLFDDSHTLSGLLGRPTTSMAQSVKKALSATH